MNKATLIQALGSVPVSRGKVLVEDQTVKDIISAMEDKHAECEKYYDSIYSYFEANSLYDVALGLWNFCKKNFSYDIEGLDDQRVSSPATMLKRGHNDCKGYSLFIGGVLDAMKRAGLYSFAWVYRYVPSSLLSGELGHVFVVINPKTDNIWVDPVMDNFNQHYFYLLKKDNNVARASQVGRLQYGLSGVAALSSKQSGGYYGQLVFNNQNLIPGAGSAFLTNPPVTYWLNGAQLVLPPPNMVVGAPVPPLPVGLRVQYAPSFMGIPIPANMPRPVVASQNRLQLAPLELGLSGAQTNQMLTANGNFLLNILMSATGALVNAYSSRPYSNPAVNGPGTSGAFNDLSHYILDLRNKDNFLDPQVEKTFAGNVISDVANVVLPVVEVVAPTVVNAVVPGAGTALKAGLQAEDNLLKGYTNQNTGTNVLPASAPGAAPVTVGGIPLWLKIAAVGVIAYFLID
jgi:hypothetical protein